MSAYWICYSIITRCLKLPIDWLTQWRLAYYTKLTNPLDYISEISVFFFNSCSFRIVECSLHLSKLSLKYSLCVKTMLITSAEEGNYVFTSVCLSVCRITEKVVNGFWRKFLGGVWHGPGTRWLNFGDDLDLDHPPDPGVRSLKSGFTGLLKST